MIDRQRLLSVAILSAALMILANCGPSGVTLLKPSNLVNYQYVTCYPHGNDPSVVNACIQYYEKRGFVKEDQINMLQM
jgi:hypothetical protein